MRHPVVSKYSRDIRGMVGSEEHRIFRSSQAAYARLLSRTKVGNNSHREKEKTEGTRTLEKRMTEATETIGSSPSRTDLP